MMTSNPVSGNFALKTLASAALSAGIVIAQFGAGVAFYRERVIHRWGAPDAVVLYLPAAVAVLLHILVWRRFQLRTPITVVLVLLTFFVTLLVNVNVFGS